MGSVVLVVDDNEVHCYAMTKSLQSAGFEVASAHTGSKALEILSAVGVDAVLLDINLPDMNGIEVCRRIKANPKTAHLPVVFHSATHASGDWRLRAEQVGAIGFMTYPIEREHLLTVLRGAIERSKTI